MVNNPRRIDTVSPPAPATSCHTHRFGYVWTSVKVKKSKGSDQSSLTEPTDNKGKLSQKACYPRLKQRFSTLKRGFNLSIH